MKTLLIKEMKYSRPSPITWSFKILLASMKDCLIKAFDTDVPASSYVVPLYKAGEEH